MKEETGNDKRFIVELDENTKKQLQEPTNWSLYQGMLGFSKRCFKLEKITKIILVISITNLLLTILWK